MTGKGILSSGLISILPLLPAICLGQHSIGGIVRDNEEQRPLSGVHVQGDGQVDSTDQKGRFRLELKRTPDSLVIRKIGFQSRTLPIDPSDTLIRVELAPLEHHLQEVVVTGITPFGSLKESSASITRLNKRSFQTLDDPVPTRALDQVPGVFAHRGTYTTNRISIRGTGARSPYSTRKIKAYYGGIPITSGEGVSTLEDIDPSLLDHADVIRGPATIYGANLGGVIHLEPDRNQPLGWHFGTTTEGGSFGYKRASSMVSKGGQKGNFKLRYSRSHSDGYRENNRFDEHNIAATARFDPDPGNTIDITALYTDVRAFIPSSLDSATYYESPEKAAKSWGDAEGYEDYQKAMLGLSHMHIFSNQFRSRMSLFFSGRDNFEPRPFNLLEEKKRAAGVRGLLTWDGRDSSDLRITLGTEIYNGRYRRTISDHRTGEPDSTLNRDQQHRRYTNIFLTGKTELFPGLLVSAGVNHNRTGYDLKDRYARDSVDRSGQKRFEGILSPRFSLILQAGDHLKIRGTFAHGFSPPSVRETVRPEGGPVSDIRPSMGKTVENSIRGSFPGSRLSFESTIYFMRIEDRLVARRTGPDEYIGVNAGLTRHYGWEFRGKKRFFGNDKGIPRMSLSATLTATRDRFVDFKDQGIVHDGNRIPGLPGVKSKLSLRVGKDKGFSGRIGSRFVGEMALDDENSGKTAPYHILNTRVRYSKELDETFRLTAFGGIRNILNTHYPAMVLINAPSFGGAPPRPYYPGRPRHFRIGLRIQR